MIINDEFGNKIDTNILEIQEQQLAEKYIEKNDIVLELGARYGSVSITINKKLNCKTKQVVVEPDSRVWNALEENKLKNGCQFEIVKGFISEKTLGLTNLNAWHGGYGATYTIEDKSEIPSYTLNSIEIKYGLKFNVLVADCEGFLEIFLDENPKLYDDLRMIIFEADYPEKCNYEKIINNLRLNNFEETEGGFQNVWIRK